MSDRSQIRTRHPWRFVELFAISGIALAQPTYQVLNKNTSLLGYRDISGPEFIALGLLIALAPPLLAWLVVLAVDRFAPNAVGVVHASIIGAAIAILAVQAVKHGLGWHLNAAIPSALAAFVLATACVWRWKLCRQWLHWLAIAPFVTTSLFLVASPAASVAFGESRGGKAMLNTKPSRIVMIVLDELPLSSLIDAGNPGRIDASHFPNFAALANGSTWYRNTSTVAPFTDAAVPAILTGNYPTGESTPARVANHPNNLFTALGPTFKMHVHESVTNLCPIRLCKRAGAGGSTATSRLQKVVSDAWTLWKQFTNPDAPPPIPDFTGVLALDNDPLITGERFASQLRGSRARQLDFLHVFLPHLPWRYLPSEKQLPDTGTPPGLVANHWVNDWAGLSGLQRHLLQLQAVDRLLGTVIQQLANEALWEDSMVIVTADHGVSFIGGDPLRGVTDRNAGNIAFVPLFVKYPQQRRGMVDDRASELIDIFPTIAEVLGSSVPASVDGTSLLSKQAPTRPIRLQDWKLNSSLPQGSENFVRFERPQLFAEAIRGRTAFSTTSLYSIGEYGQLLGRNVTSSLEQDSTTVTIDNPATYEHVQSDGKIAPWLEIRGSSHGVKDKTPVGITINGRLAGFAQTDRSGKWWAMLDPASFVDGRNQVAVYAISGGSGSPRFQRLRAAPR